MLGTWGLDVYLLHPSDAHRVASVGFKHEEPPQPILLGEGAHCLNIRLSLDSEQATHIETG